MNRRSFLGGTVAAIGGSLFVGKTNTVQAESKSEITADKDNRVDAGIKIDAFGDFIFPGFLTVFVDGEEAFRMVEGDEITAERNCRIVAFRNFESKPYHVFYMHEGDSLTIDG